MTGEWLAPAMFLALVLIVFSGYPVAFGLGGVAILFTVLGVEAGLFDWHLLFAMPERIFGIMSNYVLLAVPFFVFMGTMLERSRLAEDLLRTLGVLFGPVRGGLALAVVFVGALLAAATGVVGASVVAMGMISLPVMLRYGYSRPLAAGVITASGTLGQIIPPSVVLVILAMLRPSVAPALPSAERSLPGPVLARQVAFVMLPPLFLILVVLGSIFAGIATPTEAGAMGASGALLLAALHRRLSLKAVREAALETLKLTAMVVMLLIGSTYFALVFRALSGDLWFEHLLVNLPGGVIGFLIISNLVIFLLGFFIDFFEIAFIVVPLLAPAAIRLGIDPVWFGVMIGVNLQTSFLTPPFGFALFYLRGVAPPEVRTIDIYRGVMPFILIQLIGLALICLFPGIVLW